MMSTRRSTVLFVSVAVALYPGVISAQPPPVEPPPPEGDVAPVEEPAEIQPPPEAFEEPPPEPPPPVEEPPPPEPPPQPVEPAADVEPEDDDPMRVREGAEISFNPGEGLRITSADGDFRVQIRFRAQFLYQLEWEDGEQVEHQFTVRRARLQFTGHFFGEDNRYKIELAFAPRDMGMRDNVGSTGMTPDETVPGDRPRLTPILEWYYESSHIRDLNVRAGQFKVPFDRERLMSSADLSFVDRSITQNEFTLERDVGLMVFSKDLFELGVLRYQLGVFMARGRDSVGFDDFGMMYALRIDVTPMGAFSDMAMTDFDRSDPHLGIGLAAAFVDDGLRTRGSQGDLWADGGTADTFHLTFDAIFKVAGFTALGVFQLRLGNRDPGGALDEMGNPIPVDPASDAFGMTFQAGYLLEPIPIEIVAQYSQVRRIGDATESIAEDQNALGLGVNFFFAEHPFKLQIDFFRIWSDEFGEGSAENVFRAMLQASL